MRIKVTSQLDLKKGDCRTSLVWVQWLRFHTSTTGGVGLIPGQRRYTCCALWQKKKKREEITLDCWDGKKTKAKDNGRVCQREGSEAGRRDLNHEKDLTNCR